MCPSAGGFGTYSLKFRGQFRIGRLAVAPKFLDQGRLGLGVEVSGGENDCLATRAFDFDPQPLKILAGFG